MAQAQAQTKGETPKFKKGQMVKFAMPTAHATKTGEGKIKELPPKETAKGQGRLLVVDAEGKQHRPWPTQCKAIA